MNIMITTTTNQTVYRSCGHGTTALTQYHIAILLKYHIPIFPYYHITILRVLPYYIPGIPIFPSTNLVDCSLLGVPEVLEPIVSKTFRVHPFYVQFVPDLAHKVQLVVQQATVEVKMTGQHEQRGR